MNPFHLPVFPLPVFLLVGGKIRLRIYELKYKKLISIAAANDGFVIQLSCKQSQLHNIQWASRVVIKDFNQGLDDILEVDVICTNLVEISRVSIKDGLQFAIANPLVHWSQSQTKENLSELGALLNDVISQDKMLNSLYQGKSLINETWVIARWLELLPIDLATKNDFIHTHGIKKAKEVIYSIFDK